MFDAAESCRQTAKVSQIEKRCPNPTIVKNHKLIKLSCHPFVRCLRREFLLFFIYMRGSYVVCEFPQVSASPLCVVGPINIERIHLVSHPTAAADLNASFTYSLSRKNYQDDQIVCIHVFFNGNYISYLFSYISNSLIST
jgi:hypothetical protein